MSMRRRLSRLAGVLCVVSGAAACEHPIGIVTPHIEAADLIVTDSVGTELARTQYNRAWVPDSLVVTAGTPLRIVITPVDFRGQLIDVAERRDISFRMEAEDGALFQWEPQRGYGWIRPFVAGETHVRILIWHETHADLVTPWLRLVIRPSAATTHTQSVQ